MMSEVRVEDVRKPELVVARANGAVRLVGVGKAAEWLGVAASTVRNISAGRGAVMGYTRETIARVEREYPQVVGALVKEGRGR
jgi:malonyl CoA-acyl carrier protein transacylase